LEKKSFVERNIESLKSNNEQKKQALQVEYDKNLTSIEKNKKEIEVLSDMVSLLSGDVGGLDKLRNKQSKMISMRSKIELNRSKHADDIKFYSDNSSCPTCRQDIDEAFKDSEISRMKDKINEFEVGISDLSQKITDCVSEISRLSEIQKEITTKQIEISGKQSEVQSLMKRQKELLSSIKSIDSSDTILADNVAELQQLERDIQELEQVRNTLAEDQRYIETAAALLKDGGIKTKIIKQYLPIINKTINKYLTQMGFFASFHINESFEEVIKARHLEEFSYQNFSEGEKTRIDLAILFTWRHIAKLRNSVNCNLLIFDEIFDGSLDASGTDEFLKIMWNLAGDTNVFVISHKRDQLLDKFKKVYMFEKKRNFSCLVNPTHAVSA
jgi:DNA repair exonuclease SbcCD ATPase subunit